MTSERGGFGLRRLLALLGVAGGFAVAAPAAVAADFSVNTFGSASDANTGDGVCDSNAGTAGEQCTLTAAIEQANASGGADEIGFDRSPTGLGPTPTIVLSGSLPAITEGVKVDAGNCGVAGTPKPCVGIDGAFDQTAFTASAPGVTIRGLAIGEFGSSGAAIRATSAAGGLIVRNNWLGRTLAGGPAANGTGVLLEGSGARVGGTTPATRNVIANNTVAGVRIFKGDENQVQGNFFGTDESGSPGAANTVNVLVEGDLTGTEAGTPDDNLIGDRLGAAAAASPLCDGACNLIVAAAQSGVSLGGSPGVTSPAGATTIRGNHVGLSLGGTIANPNAFTGIDVGGAHDALIGGDHPGDRNVIAGNGTAGIQAADGVAVRGNFLGLDATGGAAVTGGVVAASLTGDAADRVTFDGNRVGGDGSTSGLGLAGSDGLVRDNVFGVGTGGEALPLDPPIAIQGAANRIGATGAGNVIGNALDPGADEATGIELAGEGADDNVIVANLIGTDGDGDPIGNEGPGVRISGGGDGNRIGGETAASQNLIANNGGDAIVVPPFGGDATANVFARNRGGPNGASADDLFVDIGGQGPGNNTGIHGGVEAPQVTAATPEVVGGTAQPGATVRVFRKASASPGELGAYVGKTTASGGGTWSLACPSAACASAPSPGQRITAAQTPASGSSELAAFVTANDAAFEVDSTADEFDLNAGDGACFTFAGDCTLRAAIEESNALPGVQTISFDPAEMGPDPTVTLTSSAIQVTARVTIRGCPQGVAGPCAGIRTNSGGSGLAVSAPKVTLSGLALSNLATAVAADPAADELTVRGSFFGLRVDGTPEANITGLEVRGDDARIGGTVPGHRNVFGSNSNTALRILGGDGALVRGNRIGTLPNGNAAAPNAGLGVVVRRDAGTADPALDNLIGETVTGGAAGSAACDGACNVISPAGGAIELGQTTDDGATRTRIRGNFIGVNRNGNAPLGGGQIAAGAARRTIIGGPEAGDRNVIFAVPGTDAVQAFDGATVRNNLVGLNSRGTAPLDPGGAGGGLQLSGDAGDPVTVRDNVIAGISYGIRVRGSDGTVTGNVVGATADGDPAGFQQEAVEVVGSDYVIGGTTAGLRNVIGGAAFGTQLRITGFGDPGNGDRNTVLGNFIGTDASGADLGGTANGIGVDNGAEDNVIGGNSLGSENVISNGFAAVNISTTGAPTDGNTVRRNRGFDNGSPFIVLGGGANDGIAAPSLDLPSSTAVTGSGARPGAVVRAFLTVDDSQSQIRRFLGQGTANGAGAFTVNFSAPLPDGACLVASQTDAAGNSSALFGPVSVGGGPCDTTGPTTTFDSGPTLGNPTTDTTPTFTFHASEAGSSFECRIDGDPFAKCRGAPGRHTPAEPLALGDHIIRVRATDPLGNTGPLKGRNFKIVAG